MRREGLRGEGVGVMNQSANLDISRTGSKLGGRKGRGDGGGAGLGKETNVLPARRSQFKIEKARR